MDPYRMKNTSACDYCPVRSACDFDRKISGCEFRNLSEMKRDDIWDRMFAEEIEHADQLDTTAAEGH